MPLLRAIEPRLGPIAARAGFVLADHFAPGEDDVGVSHLGYLLEHPERRVLLDLCEVADRRTVSAVLWAPSDLAPAGANAGVDQVAIRERTWHYDAPAASDALADDIVAEVGAWLDEAPWTAT